MLFLSIDGVKASDLLEAFVKVAATTVGAVVAFAIYVLVLVALHVTKVVSHLMLFVGDFLDLLADELIVCIYKKADTIAAPSHSVRVFTRSHLQNITVEEEDASIAPLPEHVLLFLPSHLQNTHITEPVDAPVAPEPVRLLADTHAQKNQIGESMIADHIIDSPICLLYPSSRNPIFTELSQSWSWQP